MSRFLRGDLYAVTFGGVIVVMMRIGCLRDALHLADGDSRKEPHEEQEHGQKETEAAEKHRDVDHPRPEVAPAAGDEVAVQAGHDDDEPLEPHPDVHDDAEHE